MLLLLFLTSPNTCILLIREEHRRFLLWTPGGCTEKGKQEGFCTGRAWLWSIVAKLLAQRYTPESPGSVDWNFRVKNDSLGIWAKNRSLGIPCQESLIAKVNQHLKSLQQGLPVPVKVGIAWNWFTTQGYSLSLLCHQAPGCLGDYSIWEPCGSGQSLWTG